MKILIYILLLMSSFFTLKAQKDFEPIEVSENLYAIENPQGGNIAFLVTRKGVVVVDAGATPSNGKEILKAIQSITKKPIKYLILTHMHSDHINGLSGFPDDIKIIAHSELEKNNAEFNEKKLNEYKEKIFPEYLSNLKMQLDSISDKQSDKYLELTKQYNSNVDYFEDIKRVKFRKPDITFDDFYWLKLADERIAIEYPGPAHTNDNIVVKFSNHNVIHTGDIVFNKTYPYLIEEHGVDVYNWIKILDDLYKENIYNVIPGHGEVGRKICIKDQSDYFKALSYKIEELVKSGKTLAEIKEQISPTDFDLKGNENQLPVNIEVIYSEIAKKGAEWWKF